MVRPYMFLNIIFHIFIWYKRREICVSLKFSTFLRYTFHLLTIFNPCISLGEHKLLNYFETSYKLMGGFLKWSISSNSLEVSLLRYIYFSILKRRGLLGFSTLMLPPFMFLDYKNIMSFFNYYLTRSNQETLNMTKLGLCWRFFYVYLC